jgi:N-acetylglutamate synthase-like GNAT family acetyltransferase
MSSSFNFNLTRASGSGSGEVSNVYRLVKCCDEGGPENTGSETEHKGRARLQQLHSHLHCSIIGTCLSTAELRKIVAKLADVDVTRASDLEIHHGGVTVASDKLGGKALTKALDKRHEAVIQQFAKAKDPDALAALWQQALQTGAIPGAYWALMSHRHVTPELRQRAFGEVHMLSHLVGAANRADIRRLAALELENSDWREHADHQQVRISELLDEQQNLKRECERLSLANSAIRSNASAPVDDVESLKAELRTQSQ